MGKQAQAPQVIRPKLWKKQDASQPAIPDTKRRRQSYLLPVLIILLDVIGVAQTLLWITDSGLSDETKRFIILFCIAFQILAFAAYRINRDREATITALRQTEVILLKESTLLRILIDHLPENIYVKDRNSRFLLNNTESMRILGVSRQEDLVGKSDYDFVAPEIADVWRAT